MFKSKQNRNHKPIKKMNTDEQRIIQALHCALQENDYDTARDLVTKVQHSGHKKHGYEEIVNLACRQGNIFRMMEASPFRGHQLCEEEIRDCLEWALRNGDPRNVVQCKRLLGENISVKELGQLKNPDEDVGILGCRQSSKAYLLGFIRSRLGDSLTPEEVVRLRYIEISIGRGDSD